MNSTTNSTEANVTDSYQSSGLTGITDEVDSIVEVIDVDIGFFWDFNSTRDIEKETEEQLKIIFFSISPTGLLLIKFNKNLIEPPILVTGRKLQGFE